MIRSTKGLRALALAGAASVLLAACSTTSSSTDDPSSSASSTTKADPAASCEAPSSPSQDALRIGTILPNTGTLAYLAPPAEAGVGLAVEDINAALAAGHPLVLDGDALRLLGPDRIRALTVPVILTPHAGEFDALFGRSDDDKITRARDAAARTGAVVVFKGADTVIAAPDGRTRLAPGASDWLSTAGTGDVLAGAIGAMLAAGLDPLAAAAAGVWLHGEAARRSGPAFIADDLADALRSARASL